MNPLQRLYRTKFTLLAVVSTFVGIALIFLARWATTAARGAWLTSWPVNDIGLGLFTTGLFGVLFQYVGQRDAEEDSLRRIREVITEDLAAKPDGFAALLASETRDRIIENCLGLQLGDRALAKDTYADLHEQLVAAERRYDTDVSVALAPWKGNAADGTHAMFVATIRWEYRVTPASPILRFACVSDLDEYRELQQDPSVTALWYFEPVGELQGSSEEAFQLTQFAVDGRQLQARRTARRGTQVYTVNLGRGAASRPTEVTVAYTCRVLVQEHSHMLTLDFARPTRGLKVQFAYGNCGIRYVNVLDYIASSRQARLSRSPASAPTPSIEVGFDGWVLPKAGVAFVWVLENEVSIRSEQLSPICGNRHLNQRHRPLVSELRPLKSRRGQ